MPIIIWFLFNLLCYERGTLSIPTSDKKEVTPQLGLYTDGISLAGIAGYSGDKQQVALHACYNGTLSSTSKNESYTQLDTAASFIELENIFGIYVSVSGNIDMFSPEAAPVYLRSIILEDYSISLNYYTYATSNIAVQLAGHGEKALMESGRELYKGGKNPFFGWSCGDYYFTSYEQGALLTIGLNIIFSSSSAKIEFDEKAGTTFGNIKCASERVKSYVTNNNITGSIIIHAFQIGGEPSQLSKILKNDSTGNYYALTFSFIEMDDCVKAASSLLDYARDKFPTQFSLKNNVGVRPLGISFTDYTAIEYIGLIQPVSLITPDILQSRHQLSSKLKENQYYQRKLHPLLNKGYPVELDAAFIKEAHSLLLTANSNIDVLQRKHVGAGEKHIVAVDCFNFPDKCKRIKANLDSRLQNITVSDLKFLENIKYIITNHGGVFYNTGGGLNTSWHGVSDKSKNSSKIVDVRSVSVSDEYQYHIVVCYPDDSELHEINYTGNSVDGGLSYEGKLCLINTRYCQEGIWETKIISPFSIELYNIPE